ncbi:MAG: histidine phosphatase family protein [Acetobacteraceae bacterium]
MLPAIWLVRHAETGWTRTGRYQGRADVPLDAIGAATARRLKPSLAATGAEWVVTSPLARARETARLAAPDGVAVATDARLVELDFGAWEGLTEPEAKRRFPLAMRRWKRDPAAGRPPGGESLAEALARWRGFLADPPWPGDAAVVAVVTHAAIIRLALLDATGSGPARYRGVMVPPGSLRRLPPGAGSVEA